MKSVNPFELTLLIVAFFLLVWAIRHQYRKLTRDKKQNHSLFQNRLTEHNQTAPPDVSLLTLSQRQLADWEHLMKEMETSKARPEQLRYCRQKINRFKSEVAWLRQYEK